jgi:hypothetical protein
MAGFAILAVLAIAIAVRLLAGSADRDRIEAYVRERGGRVLSIQWAPFGRGWFGEKNDRIYEVVYYDSAGRQHWATAKTSMFAGVFWTEDRVSHRRPDWYEGAPATNEPGRPLIRSLPADAEHPGESLDAKREELVRMRKRVAELEREIGDGRSAG